MAPRGKKGKQKEKEKEQKKNKVDIVLEPEHLELSQWILGLMLHNSIDNQECREMATELWDAIKSKGQKKEYLKEIEYFANFIISHRVKNVVESPRVKNIVESPRYKDFLQKFELNDEKLGELSRKEDKGYCLQFAGSDVLAEHVKDILKDRTININKNNIEDIEKYVNVNYSGALGEIVAEVIAEKPMEEKSIIGLRQIAMSEFLACLSLAGDKDDVKSLLELSAEKKLDSKMKIIASVNYPIVKIIEKKGKKDDLKEYKGVIDSIRKILPKNEEEKKNIEKSLNEEEKKNISLGYTTLGSAYYGMDEMQEAKECYKEALKFSPSFLDGVLGFTLYLLISNCNDGERYLTELKNSLSGEIEEKFVIWREKASKLKELCILGDGIITEYEKSVNDLGGVLKKDLRTNDLILFDKMKYYAAQHDVVNTVPLMQKIGYRGKKFQNDKLHLLSTMSVAKFDEDTIDFIESLLNNNGGSYYGAGLFLKLASLNDDKKDEYYRKACDFLQKENSYCNENEYTDYTKKALISLNIRFFEEAVEKGREIKDDFPPLAFIKKYHPDWYRSYIEQETNHNKFAQETEQKAENNNQKIEAVDSNTEAKKEEQITDKNIVAINKSSDESEIYVDEDTCDYFDTQGYKDLFKQLELQWAKDRDEKKGQKSSDKSPNVSKKKIPVSESFLKKEDCTITWKYAGKTWQSSDEGVVPINKYGMCFAYIDETNIRNELITKFRDSLSSAARGGKHMESINYGYRVLRLPGRDERLIAKKCYMTEDEQKFLYVFDYLTSHDGNNKIKLPGTKGTEFVPFQGDVPPAGDIDLIDENS